MGSYEYFRKIETWKFIDFLSITSNTSGEKNGDIRARWTELSKVDFRANTAI